MMSKKTKAMEQQLTQLAQENDALRAQLAAAGVEIENVKSELAKTVGERDRFRNELNGAQLDLSNAKRRLDDFRLRQEAIVNALTEAHNTRERILKEANANADRIDAEAKQRKTDILNKAQAALESAKKEAAQLIADAKRDAAGIRDAAHKDAQQVTDTALDEATELIAGAKADAETMMDEAQAAVDEKQAQVDELNFSLSEKARLALEQARKYAQIMESLAELNFETAVEARYAEKYASAAAEPENSGECADDADETSLSETNPDAADSNEMDLNEAKQGTESIRGTGGAEAMPPCGREKTCCSCDNAEAVSDPEVPDADVCGQENTELPKETEDSNPETTDEPKAQAVCSVTENGEQESHTGEEGEAEDKPETVDPADDCDEQIKTSEESEKSMKNENGKHTKSVESEFPEEYSSAASLMRSIYSIEGRDIPEEADDEGEMYDIGEGTPLTIHQDEESGEETFSLPVDPDLRDILRDIMKK